MGSREGMDDRLYQVVHVYHVTWDVRLSQPLEAACCHGLYRPCNEDTRKWTKDTCRSQDHRSQPLRSKLLEYVFRSDLALNVVVSLHRSGRRRFVDNTCYLAVVAVN